jgi:preprotein translocase subunit YajC
VNANDWASLIPLALLLVFAYLVLIRPARRRAQAIHAVQSALSVGDEVMLTSGIYGVVTSVGDERLDVEVSPGVQFAVARAAVAKIIRDVPADEPPADVPDEADATTDSADGSRPADADPEDTRPAGGTAEGGGGTAEGGTENDGRGAR